MSEPARFTVVNCFQKLLSSWHDTTTATNLLALKVLWIAFKNYYLRDTTQQHIVYLLVQIGCELLSKIIIFVTRHNHHQPDNQKQLVVNCFQKLLSSWHDTTIVSPKDIVILLWIAFKNYYLRDTTQLFTPKAHRCYRCELLSKIIIFVTRHNKLMLYDGLIFVVNCFQKLLSSWHDTTYYINLLHQKLLWIAFKNYYLRDTTQLLPLVLCLLKCCELLSKIIIFVTRHNIIWSKIEPKYVVNCFQKLLSSWHDTTSQYDFRAPLLLWIAFKNYYLRDTTQQRYSEG